MFGSFGWFNPPLSFTSVATAARGAACAGNATTTRPVTATTVTTTATSAAARVEPTFTMPLPRCARRRTYRSAGRAVCLRRVDVPCPDAPPSLVLDLHALRTRQHLHASSPTTSCAAVPPEISSSSASRR